MKKLLLLLLLSSSAFADDKENDHLNKIILPLTAEQWVTTKSALVDIGVSAAVADQDIGNIQNNVMQKLQKLSPKAEWHIISLNRQQESSGLENIAITAEARLEQAELTGLRDKAKNISKAGETYKVDNIQFTPGDDEIRAANATLRDNIFQQANAEVERVNKLYPTQKYYVHKVDFMPPMFMRPSPDMYQAMAVKSNTELSVGNKTSLKATVELASSK